ncbi:fibronectin type III domain-containing protein [Microbulbifer sp. ANSA002]|uniref:fibronectin type III domain-containing protein n=1 Tax=unclassified Microbulbifer TaxID=2619833 RepID=UPI0040424256
MLSLFRSLIALQFFFASAVVFANSLSGPSYDVDGGFNLSVDESGLDDIVFLNEIYLEEYKDGEYSRKINLPSHASSFPYAKKITVSGEGVYSYKYKYDYKYCKSNIRHSSSNAKTLIPICDEWSDTTSIVGQHSVNVFFSLSPPGSMSYSTFDSDGDYKVSWDTSDNAGIYEVFRSASDGSWDPVYSGANTSFSESGRSNGEYMYKVRACTSSQHELCSTYKTGGTVEVEITPTVPLSISVPRKGTSSTVDVSWRASNGATKYELQYRKDGGIWSNTIYSGSGTSTPIQFLNHGSIYQFRVRACNTTCSDYRESSDMAVYFKPGMPTPSISTSYSPDGKYTISWGAVDFATNYEIVQSLGWGTPPKTIYFGQELEETFTGMDAGSYNYQVRACNAIGTCSEFSSRVSVQVDLAVGVPILTVTPEDSWNGTAELSWTQIDKGSLEVSYEVLDSDDNQAYYGRRSGFSLASLINGFYCYRVRAITIKESSKFSPEACVTVQLLQPPAAPSNIFIPASPSEAYQVSWSPVDNAESYLLERRIKPAGNNSWGEWTEAYSGTDTKSQYDEDPLIFGFHEYRVKAINKAGSSDFSDTKTLTMELDPTVQIRKILYYNEADVVPAEDENPAQGIFSRDLAAFRYLDLMYVIDTDNAIINAYASGNATEPFSTLYGVNERERASQVESFILEQLAIYPDNENLQRFTLDVYYDRAVAEMILANEGIDHARIGRLGGDPRENEIEHLETAHVLLSQALLQYESLLKFNPQFLAEWGASRGQTSPRYYDPDDFAQKDVIPADQLFSGYKDVVMLYKLMSKLAETKVNQVRLSVIDGQTNTTLLAQMMNDVANLYEKLIAVDSLVQDIFVDIDFTKAQGHSGLPETVQEFGIQLSALSNTISWLSGDTNILGIPDDTLLIVQGYGVDSDTGFDSYDVLSEFLDGGLIASAKQQFIDAENSYDNYRHRIDTLSTEYTDRHQQLSDWIFELLGMEVDPGCHQSSCVVVGDNAEYGSAIALQASNIESAQLALDRNLQRMENLTSSIQIEIERRGKEEGITDAMSQVKLAYGDKKVKIAERMKAIKKKAEKRNLWNSIGDTVKGVVQVIYTGNPSTLAQGASGIVSSLNNIKDIEDIGNLEEMSIRLAAEEQAELNDLSNQLLDVESKARIRAMWLEAHTIALDIAQSEVTLKQEIERLAGMLNEAQRVLNQIFTTNKNLAERYFADPIHGVRLTTDMLRAERSFDEVQKWLFYAVNALEYKWQEAFEYGVFNKNTLFSLRNVQELYDFYSAMQSFDQISSLNGVQKAEDTISIKEHIFGYYDFINGQEQEYDHPDPEQQVDGAKLSAQEAFKEKLLLLMRDVGGDTWVTVNFSTVMELPNGNFFEGPLVVNSGSESCVASGGSYGDKIEKIALNVPVSSSNNGETTTKAKLTYGGTSFLRNKTPGIWVENDEGFGVIDEFSTHTARFWDFEKGVGLHFDDSYTVPMSANLKLFGNQEIPTSAITSIFKERSVASSNWRLSLKLVDKSGYEILDINAIEDIELIFSHRYIPRNYSDCDDPLVIPKGSIIH